MFDEKKKLYKRSYKYVKVAERDFYVYADNEEEAERLFDDAVVCGHTARAHALYTEQHPKSNKTTRHYEMTGDIEEISQLPGRSREIHSIDELVSE